MEATVKELYNTFLTLAENTSLADGGGGGIGGGGGADEGGGGGGGLYDIEQLNTNCLIQTNSTLLSTINCSNVLETCCTNCSYQCVNCTCLDPGGPGANPFHMVWYIAMIYALAFVSMVLVAAGGNIIVIWIVLAHKRMRTVTNYFLVNLAVADALISILNTLFNFIYMLYSDWPFGRNYCKFSMFIAPCTISASVFTFMAIAIDRYIAIMHPLTPRMSSSTVMGVIIGIWCTASVVAFPNILYGETYTWVFAGGDSRTICYLDWPYEISDLAYKVFLMSLNYFFPLIILTGTYFRVGRELWGSRIIGEYTSGQQMESMRSKKKVVKMMMVVVAIFGLCWLPQHVYFLVTNQNEYLTKLPYIQHVYLVIYWLAMSNSMYNPIIYCWMNARFRKGFKYVFRWLPFVRFRPSDSIDRVGGASVRMSMSDGTHRFERNGSMMQTMTESIDDASSEGSRGHSLSIARRTYYGPIRERENQL